MSAIAMSRSVTDSGSPIWRASDDIGPIASAIYCDGSWLVSSYLTGPPVLPLETDNEETACGWVQWIAEQIVASRPVVSL
ncbi:hypothetical protein ACJEIK_26190 [Mycobacterium sp. SMC-16]|jgi:hypothetical protein|uniref:hypothetical protein n=1 Tax=Mycobacterium sp. SMC-16 TaxID=3385967 RepID=UPI00390C7C27